MREVIFLVEFLKVVDEYKVFRLMVETCPGL